MKRLGYVAVAAALLLAGCADGPPARPDGLPLSVADAGPMPDRDALIRSYLRGYLKDPMSAQIEDVAGPTFTTMNASLLGPSAYGWGVCFRVNAKNSYGGYVGFHEMALIWRDGRTERVFGDMRDNMFDQALAAGACRHIRGLS